MSRYKELRYDELDDRQRKVWDNVVAGPRHAVPPPAHVWLHSPPASPTTRTSSGPT